MNGATATTVIPPFQDAGVVHAGAVHASPALAWHALWTRSHCEQLVHDQLAVKGFALFLPKIDQWSRRGGVRRLIRVPLFPGYVFLHGAMNKASYVELLKARGLVQVLGERWTGWRRFPTRRSTRSSGSSAPGFPPCRTPICGRASGCGSRGGRSRTWKAFSFAPSRTEACWWCRSIS